MGELLNLFYNKSSSDSISDFNEAKSPGIYSIYGNPSNGPTEITAFDAAMLIVITYNPKRTGRLVQFVISTSGIARSRGYSASSNSWTPWVSLK